MPLYPPAGGGAGGAAISAGTQSQNTGTVVFSNSNGVSFGLSNGVLTATVTPGAAAGIAAASAGTQAQTSGTLQFVNSNGVTFGMSNSSQITLGFGSSSLAGTGFTSTTTAGVDVKGTHATNGLSMAFPAYLTTAQPVGAYLTTARASNDAIGLNSALTANGVSVTANSSGLSLNFPAFLTTAQPVGAYLTTARASNDAIGLNSALTANGVSVTANSSGLSLNFPAFLTTAQPVGAYLTTARASNDAIGLNSALTANGVSVTANSSGLSLNFPAFLTTAALSGDTTKYAGLGTTFNGANISGSMTMNTAGLQLSLSAAAGGGGADGYNIVSMLTSTSGGGTAGATFSAQSASIGLMAGSNITLSQTSNTIVFNAPASSSLVAGANITISTAGNTISIIGGAGGGGGIGIAAGTRTATTANTLLFDNANGITFGLNAVGGSIMTASHNALTTAMQSQSSSVFAKTGFTSTTTAGTGVGGTLNTVGLSMAFPLWLTTAALSQNTSNYAGLSTGSQSTAGSDIKITLNTLGLNLGVPAWLTAGGGGGGTAVTMYATSNTTQSSTGTQALSSLMFAGAGIASVGITNGSILISVPSGGGAGDGYNIVSMLSSTSGGGTAGATFSNSAASIGLMAGSNITLSQTSNTIVFNAPNASSLAAGANITISTNGSTISIIGPSAAAGVLYMTYQNRQLGASGSTQFTNNQIWMVPFRVAGGTVSASTLQYIQSLSGTFTSAVAATHAETMKWAIYSQHSTNSSRFDSASSGSLTWQVWNSGTSSGSYAINGSTSSSAGTGILTQAAGIRMMNIPINLSITNGLYVMALAQSSSSAGYSGLFSRYGVVIDSPMPLAMGQNFGAATATSIGYVDAGSYGTTSAAYPSSIDITNIKQHSNLVPFFKMGAF